MAGASQPGDANNCIDSVLSAVVKFVVRSNGIALRASQRRWRLPRGYLLALPLSKSIRWASLPPWTAWEQNYLSNKEELRHIRFYWTTLDLPLLSNAERAEDQIEDVVVRRNPGYLIQWPQRVVKVQQQHLVRNPVSDRLPRRLQRCQRISHQPLVAHIRQKSAFPLRSRVSPDVVENFASQFSDSQPGKSRSPNPRQWRTENRELSAGAVGLVLDQDGLPPLHLRQQFPILRSHRVRCIQHNQHQVRVRQRFHRFANSNTLRLIQRAPDTRRIHQLHWNPANRHRLAHQIARRSRRRRHNRPLPFHQPVK